MNDEAVADKVHDLIIIGSGPAGYTAAIYAARANLEPLVFEGPEAGGALMTTTEIENFPGFPEGLDGTDLMERQRAQAERFGAILRHEFVDTVELSGEIKVVHAYGETYRARAVILAMGAATRYLGVNGEQELLGRGVSSCATCDGAFFKDQDVAVIGGGDSAMEEANFLTKFARTVTVVHRSSTLRASKIMLERAQRNEKVRWILDAEVQEAQGTDTLTSLRIRNRSTQDEHELAVSGMFVAIGHDPRSAMVKGQLDLDGHGYVLTEGKSSRTKIPGVFAAGDLVDPSYRQAITAAASGCVAAIDAEKWLAEAADAASAPRELADAAR